MSSLPEGERLAVLETKASNIEKKVDEGFALVTHQIALLNETLAARSAFIDQHFVNRLDFDQRMAAAEKRLDRSWVNNTLSALFGAIMAGMVSTLFFLTTR